MCVFFREMDEKSPGPIHVDIQTVEKHIVIYSYTYFALTEKKKGKLKLFVHKEARTDTEQWVTFVPVFL